MSDKTTHRFCVYIHYRASDNTPFYIGKGTRSRPKSTIGRNVYWKRIVDKHGYYIKILRADLTEQYAFKVEKRLIALYKSRGKFLTNMTDGLKTDASASYIIDSIDGKI